MWLEHLVNKIHIISSSASKADKIIKIGFNKDHSIFGEHFPGNPILPGAFIFGILKIMTKMHLLNKNASLKKIERLSYIRPIKLETELILSNQIVQSNHNQINVKVDLKDNFQNIYVKGTLVFEKENIGE